MDGTSWLSQLGSRPRSLVHWFDSSRSQSVVEAHGEAVVESLVPMFVWVLEALASCRGQLRDREEEAEREKAEREELMDRYHVEKALRKESQEVSYGTVLGGGGGGRRGRDLHG